MKIFKYTIWEYGNKKWVEIPKSQNTEQIINELIEKGYELDYSTEYVMNNNIYIDIKGAKNGK